MAILLLLLLLITGSVQIQAQPTCGKQALLLLLITGSVQIQAQPTCGKQANFSYCSPGSCCSQYGYCGTSTDYCGSGCQSQCNQEQCGIQANFATCLTATQCCSQYGFCGTGSPYCGDGCQSGPCSATPVKPIKLAYWYADSSPASNVNSCLFTHILYAFAVMNPTTFAVTPPPYDNGQIATFVTTVRSKNPTVKTILSIGGGGSDSAAFSRMAATSTARSAFINSSIALAQRYSFDGLDLDWEYPSNSTDMANLGALFSEWRARAPSGMPLAAAVYYTNPLPAWMSGAAYPVASIQANLDWVLAMSYDFHGAGWENYTNVPAPLYDPSNPTVNADYGITRWLADLTRARIVLGLPAYGYSWNLTNPAINGIGAPSSGPYNSPSLGANPSYAQIAAFLTSNPAVVPVHNETTVSTYFSSGRAWVAYDDDWSIIRKVAYLKNRGIRGYGFWHALSDDSKSTLAKAAAKALDAKYCNGTTIT